MLLWLWLLLFNRRLLRLRLIRDRLLIILSRILGATILSTRVASLRGRRNKFLFLGTSFDFTNVVGWENSLFSIGILTSPPICLLAIARVANVYHCLLQLVYGGKRRNTIFKDGDSLSNTDVQVTFILGIIVVQNVRLCEPVRWRW